mmetsp:Transcript_12093/g.14404  ORF Transcript_12093/g.14404 Transcript_12093/m.14404 type:complete len:106 (-) Transcript_12093:64-381(-)
MFIQRSIADLLYVTPSSHNTGSVIGIWSIGQRNIESSLSKPEEVSIAEECALPRVSFEAMVDKWELVYELARCICELSAQDPLTSVGPKNKIASIYGSGNDWGEQ